MNRALKPCTLDDMLVISRICILRLELPNKLLLPTYEHEWRERKATVYPLKPGPPRELKPIWWYNWNNRLWCTFYGAQGGGWGGWYSQKKLSGVLPTLPNQWSTSAIPDTLQGSYPFPKTNFQDFFRTQIDFSQTPKFTLILALPRSQC